MTEKNSTPNILLTFLRFLSFCYSKDKIVFFLFPYFFASQSKLDNNAICILHYNMLVELIYFLE